MYLIGGGTHNSVAVEFKDFVAVVEAPQNEERSLAVIAEVKKLIPGKPIKYIVNTHHHFDHSGGLRTYVAQSATIITHPINKDFYQNVLLYPSARTLQPDIMSKFYPWASFNRTPIFEPVGQKYVLSDGTRTMEMYPVTQLAHAASMLIAYLPAEKILINADLYLAARSGSHAPGDAESKHGEPETQYPAPEAGCRPARAHPRASGNERGIPCGGRQSGRSREHDLERQLEDEP